MLPVHLADNIRKQVLYYLQSTFSFRDKRASRRSGPAGVAAA
jgi:DEAD/DEAH box helicase domain-containing protein